MRWDLTQCPHCGEQVWTSPVGLLELSTLTVVPHPDGPYTTILSDGRRVFGRKLEGPVPSNVTAWTGHDVHRYQPGPTPPESPRPMSTNPKLTMPLPVKLTPEEEVQRARRLGQLSNDLERHDKEVQLYKAAKHRERKPIYAAWQNILRVVSTGMEERDVEITHRKDFAKRVIQVVRVDTGEVVDSHPMDESDMQEGLPFEVGGVPTFVEEEDVEPAEQPAPTELDEAHRPRNPRKPKSPKLSVPS